MAFGNTTALPDDNGQQPVVDANNQPGAVPADQGTSPDPQPSADPQPFQDEEDVALQTILQAAEAEEAANKGGQQQTEGGVKDPATDANLGNQGLPKDQHTNNGQHQQVGGIMIPKERLDQVLGELAKTREQNAYLAGFVKAHEQPKPADGQQQQEPPKPTAEQRIAEVHSAIDALAVKFDNGELTMADYKKQERALQVQEQAIREEVLVERTKAATQQPQKQPSNSDSLYLDQLTAKLETDHPWVQVFTELQGSDREWDYLTGIARDNLATRGIQLNGTDVARYELRKEIAVLCDKFGPSLIGEKAKAAGIKIPGAQSQQQTQQTNQLSPQAAARQRKLELAAGAPPDLAALNGNSGDTAGTMTEDRLEAIHEDEFDKLPAGLRNKLLGIDS